MISSSDAVAMITLAARRRSQQSLGLSSRRQDFGFVLFGEEKIKKSGRKGLEFWGERRDCRK